MDRMDGETDLLADNSNVIREKDSSHIAGEREKNSQHHRRVVNDYLRPVISELWRGEPPLFRLISIETGSRCNMSCGFCPVNKHEDPREPGVLPIENTWQASCRTLYWHNLSDFVVVKFLNQRR